MLLSFSTSLSADIIPWMTPPLMALRFSGRLIVILATAPFFSNKIGSVSPIPIPPYLIPFVTAHPPPCFFEPRQCHRQFFVPVPDGTGTPRDVLSCNRSRRRFAGHRS